VSGNSKAYSSSFPYPELQGIMNDLTIISNSCRLLNPNVKKNKEMVVITTTLKILS
jgi:hypothetical protein